MQKRGALPKRKTKTQRQKGARSLKKRTGTVRKSGAKKPTGNARRKVTSHGLTGAAAGVRSTAQEAVQKVPKSLDVQPQVCSPFVGYPRPSAAEVYAFHTRIAALWGERRPPKRRPHRDLLRTVVGTILSQNTTNTNSSMAMSRLAARFNKHGAIDWEAIRTAKPMDVEDPIRCGGLAPKKVVWIQDILQTLYAEQGVTSLDYLRRLSKQEVHEQLERFKGVGKKTAAIINLFDLLNPDMAVDTHVFRYACQIGWVPSDKLVRQHNAKTDERSQRWPVVTRDSCYAHLDATIPDELKYSMHLIMTDTTGGMPTECTAKQQLGWDGKQIIIDGSEVRR